MSKWVDIEKLDVYRSENDNSPFDFDEYDLVTLRDKLNDFIDQHLDDNNGKYASLRFDKRLQTCRCGGCDREIQWFLQGEVDE